jgi:hypothetical protein
MANTCWPNTCSTRVQHVLNTCWTRVQHVFNHFWHLPAPHMPASAVPTIASTRPLHPSQQVPSQPLLTDIPTASASSRRALNGPHVRLPQWSSACGASTRPATASGALARPLPGQRLPTIVLGAIALHLLAQPLPTKPLLNQCSTTVQPLFNICWHVPAPHMPAPAVRTIASTRPLH